MTSKSQLFAAAPMPDTRLGLALPMALSLIAITGCLGPQVDDTVIGTNLVLPAGTPIPTVYEDSALNERIASADGVDDLVPLIHGFADGQATSYWDFGPAPEIAAPLFYFMDPGTSEPIEHPALVDVMPGDTGYSPYWAVFFVNITDAYDGELITSIGAMEEAQRLGLIEAPVASGRYANCPIVASEVMLEMLDGSVIAADSWGFIKGERVAWYDMVGLMGATELPELAEDGITVPADDLYRLRREGGEPLSEPSRRVDMTGDGDAFDSNDILSMRVDPVTQRRTIVSVVVPASYQSIDTSMDQDVADFTTASDLFDIVDGERVAQAGNVIAYEVVEESRNIIKMPASTP